MSEPVPEEIRDFFEKIISHIRGNPLLTHSDRYRSTQQILWSQDDPHFYISMADEVEIVFALID